MTQNKNLTSLQKQAKQLRLLNEVSAKLQGLLQSPQFYQEIVNVIQNQFHYHAAHIWIVDQNGAVTLRAQAGAYGNSIKIGHVLERGSPSINASVIRTRRSYLANDVSNDPNFSNLSAQGVATQAQISVPILRGNDVVGTLSVESDKINAFDEDDIITLEAVASQIGVAMANRRLFREVKGFNTTLQKAVDEKTNALSEAHERIVQQQKLLQKENKALKSLVQKDNLSLDPIGKSTSILNILSMVDKIAPTSATALIQGESGTGKELIARRLHMRSDRAQAPYVTVNCGALQESLLESELFGHEKGSFTGAVTQKIGLAEMADGGTIFLDEIGEMSLGIQVKLLRFLQEGEFYRIGGKRPIKVNVRVISATNRDLETEVKNGRFREDLYYRLNTITLRMPPLRKRKEDIGLLVDYFMKNSRFGGSGQKIKKIDPKVYEVFQNYDWPGNIRELQNTVERMKILAESTEIQLEDIPFSIRMPKKGLKGESGDFAVDMPLDDVEKAHILRALTYFHGNKTKTAQSLGITIKTLYNKLHRYGIIDNSNAQKQSELA